MTGRLQIESDAALAHQLQNEEFSLGSNPLTPFDASSSESYTEPRIGLQHRFMRNANEPNNDDDDPPTVADTYDDDDHNSNTFLARFAGQLHGSADQEHDGIQRIPLMRQPPPYRSISDEARASLLSGWSNSGQEQQQRDVYTRPSHHEDQSATGSNASPDANHNSHPLLGSGRHMSAHSTFLLNLHEMMKSRVGPDGFTGLEGLIEQDQRENAFFGPSRASNSWSTQFEYPQQLVSPSATSNNQRRGNTNHQYSNPHGNPLVDAIMQSLNLQPPTDRDVENDNISNTNNNENNNLPTQCTATGGMSNLGCDGGNYQTINGERQTENGNRDNVQDLPGFQSAVNMLQMLMDVSNRQIEYGDGADFQDDPELQSILNILSMSMHTRGPESMMGDDNIVPDVLLNVFPEIILGGNESYDTLVNLIERRREDLSRLITRLTAVTETDSSQ